MAARRFAWVLNLDADLELARPRGSYTPTKSVRAAMASFVPVLAQALLGPEDVLIDEGSASLAGRGFTGRAFCPTPRALALLRRAGAEPEPAPPVDVLRLVNSRAFASSLGVTLPGAAFVTSLDEAQIKLASVPPVGLAWRVKRAFGMSGRGQRVVAPQAATAADLAFVRGGLKEGGVQLEPHVAIVKEYGTHGLVAQDGTCRLGSTVEQRCDTRGAWLATAALGALTAEESEVAAQLAGEARRVADALARAGYFGPFGVDAYEYRGLMDTIRVQPRSDINARYSMGFSVGLTPRHCRS